MLIGFDNDKYIQVQSQHIRERIAQFGNKLYLELGGKLFDDYHASRVLPGFQPDSKLRMLAQLQDSIEILIAISAQDIERNKMRQDLGIPYNEDVLRLREEFMKRGFYVSGVVITHYSNQVAADLYRERLARAGVSSWLHYIIEGYPHNVALIDSEQGFGKNDYVPTTRPLVVVTAPGPGSGKMAVCLSQLYNEHQHGVQAGYAKFETFPVWSLPLKHPINIAYEAATADLNDINMIDPYHLDAYNQIAINYNRDIEIFPVLKALFEGIYGTSPYKSPTDMGVNMVGYCISDDEVCREAAKQEVVRRFFTALDDMAVGVTDERETQKIQLLMREMEITPQIRRSMVAARERQEQTQCSAAAIELHDGTLVAANSGSLMGSSAALLLNVTKHLAGIDHALKLIPEDLAMPIQKMKVSYLDARNPRLHSDEVLVALSVLSEQNDNCRRALAQLPLLKGCQMHSTVMLGPVDRRIFKKLGIVVTCDPVPKESIPNF